MHVFISGRVQGVFFRANTQEKAIELEVRGFVRNLPDGRVEAVFQGDEEKVMKIVEWCYRGPKYAKVSSVDVKFEEIKKRYPNFSILFH